MALNQALGLELGVGVGHRRSVHTQVARQVRGWRECGRPCAVRRYAPAREADRAIARKAVYGFRAVNGVEALDCPCRPIYRGNYRRKEPICLVNDSGAGERSHIRPHAPLAMESAPHYTRPHQLPADISAEGAAVIVTIFVADMDRAVRFYADVLDCKIQFHFGNEWAQLQTLDGMTIGLHPESKENPAGVRGSIHLGILVKDSIQKVVEEMKAKGVKFLGPDSRRRTNPNRGIPGSRRHSALHCPTQASVVCLTWPERSHCALPP